jgi:hypothetical protein
MDTLNAAPKRRTGDHAVLTGKVRPHIAGESATGVAGQNLPSQRYITMQDMGAPWVCGPDLPFGVAEPENGRHLLGCVSQRTRQEIPAWAGSTFCHAPIIVKKPSKLNILFKAIIFQ